MSTEVEEAGFPWPGAKIPGQGLDVFPSRGDGTGEAQPEVDGECEARLVERARRGCPESGRELVLAHQDRLYRFCLQWTGNAEDAEEICQDAFVKAFAAMPRYRRRAKFSTWLFQIGLNLCRDRARSRRVRMSSITDGGDSARLAERADGGNTPYERLARSEELARLNRAIAALPRDLREALLLCAVEGFSHDEGAEILGCSARAVEGRVYRARRRLAELLKREALE